MRLIFTKDLPKNTKGSYIHFYNSIIDSKSWTPIENKQYINKNIESWQNQLATWHELVCQIGQKNYDDWWLMEASRLIAWYPKINKSLFFTVGLIRICEDLTIDEIYIVNAPKEVEILTRDAQPDWDIIRNNSGYKEKSSISALKNLLSPFRSIITMLKRSFKLSSPLPKNLANTKLIAFSNLLDFDIFQSSGDHYFGNMFDEISDLRNENKLWIFLSELRSTNEERTLLSSLRSKSYRAYILQDLLTLFDAAIILFRTGAFYFFSQRFKTKIPIISIDGMKFTSYSLFFYNETIKNKPPILALQTKYAFKAIASKITTATLFYPFEDKAIERAILSQSRNLYTIGYAHAIHNSGHLYLKQKKLEQVGPLWPNLIGCSGRAAAQWLENTNEINVDQLVTIGSKRYTNIIEKTKFTYNGALKVLVIAGLASEITMLANYVEQNNAIFKNCELTIRRYPYGYHEEQNEGIIRLKRLISDVKVEGGPLLKQIDNCDIVIYASTSAGIEAMLLGRICIYVDLHHVVPLNCLESKGDMSFLFTADNPDKLEEVIKKIEHMTLHEYNDHAIKSRDFAITLYSPVSKDKVKSLIFNTQSS
jgi:hypothetical protein